MMDCLIVWAAIGPVLAFIAGAVVVVWWDDEEDEAPPLLAHPGPMRGTILGLPGPAMSLDPFGRDRSSWSRSDDHAGGCSPSRTRSCVQCGWMEDRP